MASGGERRLTRAASGRQSLPASAALENENEVVGNAPQPAVAASTGAIPRTNRRTRHARTATEPNTNSNSNSNLSKSEKFFTWLIAPQQPQVFNNEHWLKQQVARISGKPAGYFAHLLNLKDIEDAANSCQLVGASNHDLLTPPLFRRHCCNAGFPLVLYELERYLAPVHCCVQQLQEYFHSAIRTKALLLPPNSSSSSSSSTFEMQIKCDVFLIVIEGSLSLSMQLHGSRCNKNVEMQLNACDVVYVPAAAGDAELAAVLQASSKPAPTPAAERTILLLFAVQTRQSYRALITPYLQLALKRKPPAAMLQLQALPLPLDAWQYMGCAHKRRTTLRKRKSFQKQVKDLFTEYFVQQLPVLIDSAFDELDKQFKRKTLPTTHNSFALRSAYSKPRLQLTPQTKVTLLSANVLKLTRTFIYYGQNGIMKLTMAEAAAIKELVRAYPEPINITDLCRFMAQSEQLQFANKLWEHGLIRPIEQ